MAQTASVPEKGFAPEYEQKGVLDEGSGNVAYGADDASAIPKGTIGSLVRSLALA